MRDESIIWRRRGSDQDHAAILAVLTCDNPEIDTSVHATAMLVDALPCNKPFDTSAKHLGMLYEGL